MSTRKIANSIRIMSLILGAAAITMGLPTAQAFACACCGTYKVIGVADWDVLNVRSGPGTGYQITQKLPPHEGCIIQTGERRGNWVRVEANGGKGWVNRRYLGIIR